MDISSLKNRIPLTYNYELLHDKTLGEYGISNGSIINIPEKMLNATFKNTTGLTKVLILDSDCPIKKAIELYFKHIKQENLYRKLIDRQIQISFIYRSCMLNIRDERPIKIVFSDNPNPNIIVNESNALPGGISREKN